MVGHDLQMPSEAEMRREIVKQGIALARREIEREKKIEGECTDVFYARKITAVSTLIHYKNQAPELVAQTREELQEFMNSLNTEWVTSLEYERRNK